MPNTRFGERNLINYIDFYLQLFVAKQVLMNNLTPLAKEFQNRHGNIDRGEPHIVNKQSRLWLLVIKLLEIEVDRLCPKRNDAKILISFQILY